MNIAKNTVFRVSATLLSLVFFHYFPALVATSYMSWNGFFSYDLFATGTSGVSAFYWWSEIILLTAALYLTGSLYFIATRLIKKSLNAAEWCSLGILILINIISAGGIFYPDWPLYSTFPRSAVVGIYIIAGWAMIHVGVLVNGKGIHALISIGFGAILLCTVAILSPGSLALPYSLSLQYFGNGGEVNISLTASNTEIKGKLLLASPENFYIQKGNKLVIVGRDAVTGTTIENLGGFGHRK